MRRRPDYDYFPKKIRLQRGRWRANAEIDPAEARRLDLVMARGMASVRVFGVMAAPRSVPPFRISVCCWRRKTKTRGARLLAEAAERVLAEKLGILKRLGI
jgi:hypothetical protein